MADRFWWPSGGTGTSTGNWASTTNWSSSSTSYISAAAPTSADNANFGSYSGATAFTVTIAASANCLNLVVNNANMTLAGASTLGIYGGVTITSLGARTYTGGISFLATTSVVLNFGATTLASSMTFGSTTGTWTLGSALTTTLGIIFQTGGTFSTSASNYSLTAASLTNSSGTVTISLNASSVTLTGSSPIGLTVAATIFNAGTSTITLSNFSPSIFAYGTKTFYNVVVSSPLLAAFYISGNGTTITFNNLQFPSLSSVRVTVLQLVNNITINGILTFPVASNPAITRYVLRTSSVGSQVTVTAANVSLADVDFMGITGAGAATWSGTRLGNICNNSGITFPATKVVYWNLAGSNNINAIGWATSSTGTPANTNFPLPQDIAVFTNTNPAASSAITINLAYNLPALDFTSRTVALTFTNGAVSWNSCGYITLSTAITIAGTSSISLYARSGQFLDITSAGRTWAQSFIIYAEQGTVRFIDGFVTTGVVALNSGSLTVTSTNVTASTINLSSSRTRILNMGSGTWTGSGSGATVWDATTTTGLTLNAQTSTISLTSASAKTFIGGGLNYYNIVQAGAGALTISGNNTFNNITNTVTPATVTFTASSTNTFTNFNLNGTAGNLVTINSSSAGTRATLSKASGVVSVSYLSIQDSAATGGATWNASGNSVNSGNNLGWIFTALSSGNFFPLFR